MIFDAEITDRRLIAKNTWEITFSHNESSFYFNAGQYVWIITPAGRRAFSISSSSTRPESLQIIFRYSTDNDFKKYILDHANRNVKIRGPHGFMRVPESGTRNVYIAGGVGIAPVMSILRRLKENGSIKDIDLVFVNHSHEEQFYTKEISEITGLKTTSIVGRVKKTDIGFYENAKYYVLGPQNMVDGMAVILNDMKIPPASVIYEENYPGSKILDLNYHENSYFKAAVDQSINHIIMTDTNGKIVYANSAAEVTTGYTFSEMMGQTPRLWGGLMDEKVYKDFWKILKDHKKPFKGEFRNQRKNGEEYLAAGMISPIFDNTNEIVGYLGIEQDVTESKRAEENLQKLTDLMVGRELEMIELKKKMKNE